MKIEEIHSMMSRAGLYVIYGEPTGDTFVNIRGETFKVTTMEDLKDGGTWQALLVLQGYVMDLCGTVDRIVIP